MEDIFDNPIMMEVLEGKSMRAPEEQPDIVVHRMCWQGGKEEVGRVLNEALGTMLVNLSIDRCSIGWQDLLALLALTPTLDSLEVRDVVSDERTGGAILPMPLQLQSAPDETTVFNGLSSLTVTAHTPLDDLFEVIRLPYLRLLSLRLHQKQAEHTVNMDAILSATFLSRPEGISMSEGGSRDMGSSKGKSENDESKREFRLRCRLDLPVKQQLIARMQGTGVELDYENI
ncbi:hypothetical protein NMY22_g17927 [Coprinellus aureogranulatus]|nr:hypothetical protein NMY22_g17927 [Coprinellus aureogranulatus]